MTARQAWLLGIALVALAAMLLLDLTGLAWPRLNRAELLTQMGWVGLLGLGQQVMRRHGAVDLAAGGAISLCACLVIVLAPAMGLGAALGSALLVAVSATVSQFALASRIPQPVWLGLGALALLIAASPDATGRLAPEALRRLAQEPAFASVPWILLGYVALLALGSLGVRALRHRSAAPWLAALVWWLLGLFAAGESRLGVEHALLWTAQGLAVAGLAGADLAAGALAAVSLSCAVYAASLFGSGRAEALLTALALVLAACVAAPTDESAEPR